MPLFSRPPPPAEATLEAMVELVNVSDGCSRAGIEDAGAVIGVVPGTVESVRVRIPS